MELIAFIYNVYTQVLIHVRFIKSTKSFPFTTVYRIRTFYLSRGGSWNFRTSFKGGSGHFNPLP